MPKYEENLFEEPRNFKDLIHFFNEGKRRLLFETVSGYRKRVEEGGREVSEEQLKKELAGRVKLIKISLKHESERLKLIHDYYDQVRDFCRKYHTEYDLKKVIDLLNLSDETQKELNAYLVVRSSWVETKHYLDKINRLLRKIDVKGDAKLDLKDIREKYSLVKAAHIDGTMPWTRLYKFDLWDLVHKTATDEKEQFNYVGPQEYLGLILRNPELMIGNMLQAIMLGKYGTNRSLFVASLGSNIGPMFHYLERQKKRFNVPRKTPSILHADTAFTVIEKMKDGNIEPPQYSQKVPLKEGKQEKKKAKIVVSNEYVSEEGELEVPPLLLSYFLAHMPPVFTDENGEDHLVIRSLYGYMKKRLETYVEPKRINEFIGGFKEHGKSIQKKHKIYIGVKDATDVLEKMETDHRFSDITNRISMLKKDLEGYKNLTEVSEDDNEQLGIEYEKKVDFNESVKHNFPFTTESGWGRRVQATPESVTGEKFAEVLQKAIEKAGNKDLNFIDISFLVHHLPKEEWMPFFKNLSKVLKNSEKDVIISLFEKGGGVKEALTLMDMREKEGRPPLKEHLHEMNAIELFKLIHKCFGVSMIPAFQDPEISITKNESAHKLLPLNLKSYFGPKFDPNIFQILIKLERNRSK